MMYFIKRPFIWLGRINRCRGFGIQSPWAYDMVTRVINNRSPREAYADMRSRHPDTGRAQRSVLELLLRLTAELKPPVIYSSGIYADTAADYMLAGCGNYGTAAKTAGIPEGMTSFKISGDAPAPDNGGGMETGGAKTRWAAFVSQSENAPLHTEYLCDNAPDGSLLVLNAAGGDRRMRRLWRKILADVPHTVTFDLYYCGIVYFDKKRFKENHIINF